MMNVQVPLLSASNASNQTGAAQNSNQLIAASFQTIMGDTTAAGTVKVQGSNDMPQQGDLSPSTPSNWSDIPSATAAVTAGVAPMILISQLSYRWIRVVWTQTTPGTSTITVNMFAMSV